MDFIREGGWPMFPTLVLGIAALVLAVRYAARPERGQRALVNMVALVTLLMGILGTLLGVQLSANGIRDVGPDQKWIFLIGLAESLSCVLGALVLLIPTMIFAGIGGYREAQK
jgi:uncharacterized membrane protein HdeD (DUF308 family)